MYFFSSFFLKRYVSCLATALCVVFPVVHAASDYDLGGASPLANLFSGVSARIAAPAEKAIVERPKERGKLVLRQEVRSDWENRFARLCNALPADWHLQDSALEVQLKFALMNDDAFVASLVEVRKATISAWDDWYSADDKTVPRQKLAAVVEKNIKKMPGNSEVLAKWIIDADLNGKSSDFIPLMIQRITSLPAYHFLLLSCLGFPHFSTDVCRQISAVKLSDDDSLRQIFAFLVVAYRSEYDAQYPAAFESYARIPFMRQFNLSSAQMVAAEKAEYLKTSVPATLEHVDEWNQMIALARGKAHDEATRLIKNILEKMRNVCVFFQARLEAIRIADAVFQYTASTAALSDTQYYSLLLGVMCRSAQRMFIGHEDLNDSKVLQGIMLQEYRDQVAFGRISGVLAGEKSGASLRKSFEARIAFLNGTIDFFRPVAFEVKLKDALMPYKVEKATELYKKIALVCAYVNGVLWQITPESTDVYKAFTQTVQLTRGYIETTLALSVATQEDLKNTYTQLIDQIVADGAITKSFSSKSGISLAGFTLPQQQALYKLMWLYIGTRLVSTFGKTRNTTTKQSLIDPAAKDDGVESSGSTGFNELPRAIVDTFDDGLSPGKKVLRDAQENFSQFGQRIGHRVETVTRNLTKGSREEVAAGLTDALADTGDFINGLQGVIHDMYIQSNHVYGRMNATFKALTLYTHHLNEYATKKISNYKKVVDDLVSGLAGKIGMPIVKYFLEKAARQARITANQDDDRLKRLLDGAFADLKLAIAGKKTVDDLPAVPAALPSRSIKSLAESLYDVGSPAVAAAA